MDSTDNRLAYILLTLCSTPTISSGALAEKLQVSERTISNDIKQLETELKDCATIRNNPRCMSSTRYGFGPSGQTSWRRRAGLTPSAGGWIIYSAGWYGLRSLCLQMNWPMR